jgi:hypothetical protein
MRYEQPPCPPTVYDGVTAVKPGAPIAAMNHLRSSIAQPHACCALNQQAWGLPLQGTSIMSLTVRWHA